MPEYTKAPRYRRDEEAPRVDAEAWVRLMCRRVEAQLSRDWNFGFVSWSYKFHSSINLSRTFFVYGHKSQSEESSAFTRKIDDNESTSVADPDNAQTNRIGFVPEDFQEGAKSLCRFVG